MSIPSTTLPKCSARISDGCGPWKLQIDMFAEDGCLLVYGVAEDGVPVMFTERRLST